MTDLALMPATGLALMPATDLARAYAEKRLSPVEVTEATLARIEALDPTLNFYRMVAAEEALDQARASQERWARGAALSPVDGVTVSVKDHLHVMGWLTLHGTLVTVPAEPMEFDAPAVAHLRAGGAVLLGKTATPEFATKAVTESPVTGITANPWNPDRTPGGSSGGAAVAAAVGGAAINLGTDGGGSIRMPACFCGVVGIKPTYGRVPAYPPSPALALSHVGPLTRTVADAALAMEMIARPDPRDWHEAGFPPEAFLDGVEAGVAGLTVAFAPTMNGEPVEPAIAERARAAADALSDAGARVTEITFAEPDWHRVWTVFAAVTCFMRVSQMTGEQVGHLDDTFAAVAELGRNTSLYDYQVALLERSYIGSRLRQFFATGGWDLLLTPTLPIEAFEVGQTFPGEDTDDPRPRFSPFTGLFNLTGQPAVTVPTGLGAEGLPVGVQIAGPAGADLLTLRAARVIERALPLGPPPAVR